MNFFLDIDGTLIPKRGALTNTLIDVIKRAQKLGHRFFINTARPVAFAPKNFPFEIFDGLCFGCGTYIEYKGEVLYRRLMTVSELQLAVDTVLGHRPDIRLVLEGEDVLYYNFEVPFSSEFTMCPYTSFEALKKEHKCLKIQKLATYGGCCIDEHTAELLSEHFDVYLHKTYSEIVLKGYNKGRAVVLVERELKLDGETTVAIGDSYNDLPMLTYCDISVAMGNAPLEVKQLCSQVTEAVEDDGAAKAIARLCGLNYSESAV